MGRVFLTSPQSEGGKIKLGLSIGVPNNFGLSGVTHFENKRKKYSGAVPNNTERFDNDL